MQHAYGYFPLNPSMGLACVILSYNERITMTLIADAAIIPNVTDLRDCLQSAYTALRQAARVPEMPLPKDAPPTLAKTAAPTPPTLVNAAAPVAAPALPEAAAPPELAAAEASDPPPPMVEQVDPPVESSAELPAKVPAPAAQIEPPELPAAPLNDPPMTESGADSLPMSEPAPLNDPPVSEPGANLALTGDAMLFAPPAPEPQPEALAASATNAAAAPAVSALIDLAAPPQSYTNGKTTAPPSLFSEAWAQAYQQAINRSAAYRAASLRWDAGSLAFVIHASPRHGLVTPTAVLLDLYRGDCRAAHSVPVESAMRGAHFVIEGDYDSWLKVLRGEADPLKMLMRGGLRLSKGSMLRLLPFTQSAQELVHSAQNIS
jgi:putative sterol carrier protein